MALQNIVINIDDILNYNLTCTVFLSECLKTTLSWWGEGEEVVVFSLGRLQLDMKE